jgi:hypothetical protein
MRLAVIAATTILVLAVACDDGDDDRVAVTTPSGPTPTTLPIDIDSIGDPLAVIQFSGESPFPFAPPSDSSDVDEDVIAECEAAIADVRSYRYRNEMRMELTNAEDALDQVKELEVAKLVAFGTPEPQAQADVESRSQENPLSFMFDGPVAERFEGAFQAPASWQAAPGPDVDSDGESDSDQIVVIGESAWTMNDSRWTELTQEDAAYIDESGASPLFLSDDYCQETAAFLATVDDITPEEEEIGDVTVHRYRLDTDDFNRFSAAAAPTPVEGESVALFSTAQMDVWFNSEAYQVMKITVDAEIDPSSEESGILGDLLPGIGMEFSGSFEIFDLNDPSISIEPPI